MSTRQRHELHEIVSKGILSTGMRRLEFQKIDMSGCVPNTNERAEIKTSNHMLL